MVKRVALVIGSGSVKCAAALGLYNVLNREGIEVDMFVGCSAGSIYATLLASGIDTRTAAEMTKRLWTREVTSQPNRLAMLRAMMPKLFGFSSRFGLRRDELIFERLREAFGEKRIEQFPRRLFITATDFQNGDQVVISSGPVVHAIRASIAIPYIFEPFEIDNRLLIDGFMSDPLPVGVAIREGASIIIAMGFESPYQSNVKSVGRFSFQLSSIMTNNLLKSRFAFHNLAHHAELLLVMPQFRDRIRLFDVDKIPSIIEDGERAAEEQIPYLRRILASEESARVAL
jgi:NTE family protein